jgi:hypothetical protein
VEVPSPRDRNLLTLLPTRCLPAYEVGGTSTHLQNAGFESSTAGEFWQVDKSRPTSRSRLASIVSELELN